MTVMDDAIPFSYVKYETWQSLANKLDPESAVKGNNWKMLAEKLGYTTENIQCIEARLTSHGRNTLKLFEEYSQKRGSSVDQLETALEEMDRPDALQVLLDAIPDIGQRYEQEKKQCHPHRRPAVPQENDWISSMGCSSVPHTHSVMSSVCSAHVHHGSMPHSPGQHAGQCPTMAGRSYPEIHSHVLHATSVSNTRTTQNVTTHVSNGEGETRTVYRNHASLYAPIQHSVGHHSMRVNFDPQDRDYQYVNGDHEDVEMGDEQDSAFREEAVPPPAGIIRNQFNLVNPQDMAVAAEEVVVSGSTSFTPNVKVIYDRNRCARQVSDENNLQQPVRAGSSAANSKVTLQLDIPKTSNGHVEQMEEDVFESPTSSLPATPASANPLDKLQELSYLGNYRPDPQYQKLMQEKHEEEVLQRKLNVNIKQEPHNYAATEGFNGVPQSSANTPCTNTGMADNARKATDLYSHVKPSRMRTGVAGRTPGQMEAPNTFPLRMKPQHASASFTYEIEKQLEKPSALTKSMSMPNDMKPAPYRKAFRHIKVLVTYADDNDRHIRRVLNFCNCLEKNGFTCCMDIYHRRLQMEDKVGWYDQRFREADFILVCISPQYRAEVGNCDTEEIDMENISDHQLHTKYIYKLMQTEYVRNGSRNTRFIPLIFNGATRDHVPTWLQNTLIYNWPKQYLDLFWMLTKPEERIKPRAKSYTLQNNTSTVQEVKNNSI